MNEPLQTQFWGVGEGILSYLPNLVAGLILIILGWLLGWVAKRVVIQMAVILRLERFLTSFRWGADFAKADVRYGFYNLLGNIAFFIVFLIFLTNAFSAWKLTVLSNLLENGIYFIPKLVIALAIFGIGWLIAGWSARAVQRALHRESVPGATLIARFTRAVFLLFFSAMALVEMDVAREVVIIGFATIFITLGLLTIVLTAVGGREFIGKIMKTFEEE